MSTGSVQKRSPKPRSAGVRWFSAHGLRHTLPTAAVALIVLSWGAAAFAEVLVEPRLFRVADAQRRIYFEVDSLSLNRPMGRSVGGGTELALGGELGWRMSPWVIDNLQTNAIRFLGPGNYGLTILRQGTMAGLAAGPIALQAGIAVSILNADVMEDQFSVGMMWPAATARALVQLGPLTVSLETRSEYWWRWFGSDRYVRSLGIAIGLEQRATPPFAHDADTDGSGPQ